MKNIIIKISLILLLVVTIIVFIYYNVFKSKKNTYKNNFYNSNSLKISESDYKIDNIELGMSIDEVKNFLGEPDEVSEFVDTDNPESSYKRLDYENLIVQFNYDNETVNYIALSKQDINNSRGIKIGSTVTDILRSYYADKNIEIYNDTYGCYEILYGEDDVVNYLSDLTSTGKTFAYIYKYNDQICSVIYCENGKVLEFYITDNKVNMMIIAEEYIPW